MPTPRAPGRAVTIVDVARRAGVSTGTASKALNGRGQLRTQTRDAVRQAADELGYSANDMARGLLSGRSHTVGVISADSFGRFSMPVMLGAEDALSGEQIAVVLCDTRDDPVRERHYISTLIARQVDGLIVTSRHSSPRPPIELPSPRPTVYVTAPSTDERDISIVSDDVGGARSAIDYLVALGRRRIAHITGPERHRAARDRASGASEGLDATGRELVGGRVLFGEWSEPWGRQASAIAVTADPKLDAVMCGSDQVARGVIDGLRALGRRVPDDVAVVGFDNWDVMAVGRTPSLTTVDPELTSLGRRAGELLLAAIGGRTESGLHVVTPRLVVRDSTSALTAAS